MQAEPENVKTHDVVPMPPPQSNYAPVFIINPSPEYFGDVAVGGGSSYRIEGVKSGQPYTVKRILSQPIPMDIGAGKKVDHWITAMEVAQEILRQSAMSTERDANPFGLRISLTEVPSDDLVEDGWQEFLQFAARKIELGDAIFNETGKVHDVPAVCKRCAVLVGHNAEWCRVVRPTTDCPVCFERIQPGAKKCLHCNTWLDADAEAKYAPRPREAHPAPDVAADEPKVAGKHANKNKQ